jgi:hypothetical protein
LHLGDRQGPGALGGARRHELERGAGEGNLQGGRARPLPGQESVPGRRGADHGGAVRRHQALGAGTFRQYSRHRLHRRTGFRARILFIRGGDVAAGRAHPGRLGDRHGRRGSRPPHLPHRLSQGAGHGSLQDARRDHQERPRLLQAARHRDAAPQRDAACGAGKEGAGRVRGSGAG